MDEALLLKLIDHSLTHFKIKIKELIDEIASILENDKAFRDAIERNELIKIFYERLFRNTYIGVPYLQQLIIDSPDDKFIREFSDLMFNVPGIEKRNLSYLVYNHPHKIISDIIINRKLDVFYFTKCAKEFPEFKMLQKELVNNYNGFLKKAFSNSKQPIEQQASALLGLIINLNVINLLKGTLTKELKIKYIDSFINGIQDKTPRVIYFGALAGFQFDGELELSKDCWIKRFDKSDFATINDFAFFEKQEIIHFPTLFVLKMTPYVRNLSELQILEQRMLTILRLFKLSEVFISYRTLFIESVFRLREIKKQSNHHKRSERIWYLDQSESEVLIDFVSVISSPLTDKLENNNHKAIQFALERFNWALMDDIGTDRRFLFVIMGLEPLFLPEMKTGKGKRLGIRLSVILEEFGFKINEVKTNSEEAYQIRNYIAHGKKMSKKMEERMNELYPLLLNYLRISLIIFLLNIDKGRNGFVNEIDNSLINRKIQIDLKEFLKTIYNRFKISFELNN